MENITFTKEQKEQIKQNALAIERYIVENVVPRLAGDVRLEFGGTHHCPRTGATTPTYVLVVKKEPYYFCAGWNKTQEAAVVGKTPSKSISSKPNTMCYRRYGQIHK